MTAGIWRTSSNAAMTSSLPLTWSAARTFDASTPGRGVGWGLWGLCGWRRSHPLLAPVTATQLSARNSRRERNDTAPLTMHLARALSRLRRVRFRLVWPWGFSEREQSHHPRAGSRADVWNADGRQ